MPTRIGEAERIGGSDHLPIWRIALSEEPTAEWRRRFLRLAHEGNIFHGLPLRVEAMTLVFEIEHSALRLACEKIDQWLAAANGAALSVPSAHAILVVDDEHEVTRLARDMLQPVGYTVLCTADPFEAIRIGRQSPGDLALLLTDVVMPLMDGRELARRMLMLRPTMKVILMSGYEVSGLATTGWPFLAKPFGIKDLTQKVADALKQSSR
jgi:CheY-like chemotaxis protein